MSFTLYNYVLSGNCYKIRLLAHLLDVNYNSVAVDFHPGRKHKSETLLQINPAGTLPVLVADSLVLTETQAMLVWIAQRFDPDGEWWPTHNANTTAAVIQWMAFATRLGTTVGELRLHCMLNKTIDVPAAGTGSKRVLRELESHLSEQQIRGFTWLVRDTPTVADIACFPNVALSPDAGIDHDNYPAIRRWLHAIRSLDGFITMPGIHELHESHESRGTDTKGSEASIALVDHTGRDK